MYALLLMTAALAAEPAAEKATAMELLATFHQEFIPITPGEGRYPASFQMGSKDGPQAEQPVHTVMMTKPFSIAKYEVPQNLWEAVMGSNPSRWKGPRNSVEMLSYGDAVAFCEKATAMMRKAGLIGPQQVIRLPSEAEWEYVARAGTTTAYSFGDDVKDLDAYGWYTGNAAGNDPPVGAKKPNAWGLYDVHGYLWEWCADAWQADYDGAPKDGSARTSEEDEPKRVLRGGSWKDQADMLTSSYRVGLPAGKKDDAVGLRCVLSGPAE